VKLERGGTLQCWIYVYNRKPAAAQILNSGKRFRKKQRGSKGGIQEQL
jgi:hypothetical protein